MIDRRLSRNILTLLAGVAPLAPLEAQEPRDLSELDGRHLLRAEAVITLDFSELDRAPDILSQVIPFPSGSWGVTSSIFGGEVQRFDSDGEPIGAFGATGQGPGEFGGPVSGLLVDRRLWLVDPANARLSVFSEDLVLEGSRPLPGRVRAAAPGPGRDGVLLTGFFSQGDEMVSTALVSLDPERDVLGGAIESPNPRVALKVAAVAPTGEVWTFQNSGGGVNVLSTDDLSVRERWRLPGEELAREASRRPSPDRPPAPQTIGVRSGADLLWVLIGVADAEWTPGTTPAAGAEGYWDTLVIAIDPAARTVVARGRLDPLCLPIADALISCVDELGETVRVARLEVDGR